MQLSVGRDGLIVIALRYIAKWMSGHWNTSLQEIRKTLTKARADEWDDIERMLNNNSFFSFITPRNTWKEDDGMTVLLRYAGLIPTKTEQEEEVFPFLTRILDELKTKSRVTIWKMIYSAFYRLSEWYNDTIP